mgnify:CR=1 FL=1
MHKRLIRPLAAAAIASFALLVAPPASAKGTLRATISTSLNQPDPANPTHGHEHTHGGPGSAGPSGAGLAESSLRPGST